MGGLTNIMEPCCSGGASGAYITNAGNGSDLTFLVTHDKNTWTPIVHVARIAGDVPTGDEIFYLATAKSANSVQVTLYSPTGDIITAPATNALRVTISTPN